MQPTLTVEGKEFEVYSVYYRQGKINSVTVEDESGNLVNYHDINEDTQYYVEQPLKIDFATALKFPGFDAEIKQREDKLIEHLDTMLTNEDNNLLGMANDMARTKVELPFEKLEEKLVKLKMEYDSAEQRVLGMIDAVEEVKAFLEGYYAPSTD